VTDEKKGTSTHNRDKDGNFSNTPTEFPDKKKEKPKNNGKK
jgi:hypothetical protein